MKNEIVLLPAFLDHHRSLGVEQFLVLVDYSDDGTLELLLTQSDVVVLTSDIKFGDFINVSILDRFGFTHEDHAGKILKEVITQNFFTRPMASTRMRMSFFSCPRLSHPCAR